MEWIEDWSKMCGGEGVTLQMVPLTREKRPDKKKIGNDRTRESKEADRRTEKEEKKCHKDPQPVRQREKKKKTRETKKKRWKRKKSTKVGIHIPPSPTALEYKNTKKKRFFRLRKF